MSTLDSFWERCMEALKSDLSAQQFNTWIKPLSGRFENGVLTLFAPNQFIVRFVQDRFSTAIKARAATLANMAVELVFSIEAVANPLELIQAVTHPSPASDSTPPGTTQKRNAKGQNPAAPSRPDTSQLIASHTFETFVIGKANQLARAAALQIAENPGQAYNPLFLYGGSGFGKTHLMHAIGNFVLQQNPRAKIRYIHSERYVQDVVRAYQHKNFDDFKRYYHSLDLLLVDDIQFLGKKDRTQEEFFYAFNALLDNKKQIVISCDTVPQEISDMQERLTSRFSSGLSVAIEAPELEMRSAILIKKAESEKMHLDPKIALFIAKNIQLSVRELEGALKKVLAYSRFHHNEPISLEMVHEALKDLLDVQPNKQQLSIEEIQSAISQYYGVSLEDLKSKKRAQEIARPRQIAMLLAKELTQLSLPNIGEAFGGRDHTTVLHACTKINQLRKAQVGIQRDFDALLLQLRNQ